MISTNEISNIRADSVAAAARVFARRLSAGMDEGTVRRADAHARAFLDDGAINAGMFRFLSIVRP